MAIAVDASTPARATASSAQAVTTATFSPPACILVACTSCTGGSNLNATVAITDNNGGFTWNQVQLANPTTTSNTGLDGTAAMHYAVLPAGATNLTVTATQTSGSSPTSLKVYVLTGTAMTGSIAVHATIGNSTAASFTTSSFTSQSASSLFMCSSNEWTAPGTAPTSSDLTADGYTSGTSLSGLSGYKSITSSGTSQNCNLATTTGSRQWMYVTAEILAPSGLPRPPLRVLQAINRASTY